MKRILGRLSYANVVATLALFIALGGASYAALKLPKNSVGARQLKKGAVTPAKFSAASKSRFAGTAGPRGPQGPKGDPGAPGAAGAPATSLWAEVNNGGTLLKGRGAIAVTHSAGSDIYQVRFDRDVSACTYIAAHVNGVPNAQVMAELVPFNPQNDRVTVETADSNGVGTEKAFSLAVFC